MSIEPAVRMICAAKLMLKATATCLRAILRSYVTYYASMDTIAEALEEADVPDTVAKMLTKVEKRLEGESIYDALVRIEEAIVMLDSVPSGYGLETHIKKAPKSHVRETCDYLERALRMVQEALRDTQGLGLIGERAYRVLMEHIEFAGMLLCRAYREIREEVPKFDFEPPRCRNI